MLLYFLANIYTSKCVCVARACVRVHACLRVSVCLRACLRACVRVCVCAGVLVCIIYYNRYIMQRNLLKTKQKMVTTTAATGTSLSTRGNHMENRPQDRLSTDTTILQLCYLFSDDDGSSRVKAAYFLICCVLIEIPGSLLSNTN